MDEVTVKIESGEVVLKKPKAGIRNKAIIVAETDKGVKGMVFMVELLPYCVKSHPFRMTPIREALDNLSIEDYDKLIDGLKQIMEQKGDVEKKSVKPSESSQPVKASK